METSIDKTTLMALFYVLSKSFREITNGILVDTDGIRRIKDLLQQGQRVILVPKLSSFLDYAILLFTLASYGIEIPVTFGAVSKKSISPDLDEVLSKIGFIRMNENEE